MSPIRKKLSYILEISFKSGAIMLLMTLLIHYLLNLITELRLFSDPELDFIHKQMQAVLFTRAFLV